MRVPSKIIAGDSPTWTDDPLVTADGVALDAGHYALTYSFRGPLPTGVDLASTAIGGSWSTSLTAAQTTAFNTTPGNLVWTWQAYATLLTDATKRLQAGAGSMKVLSSLAATPVGTIVDGRTQSEIDLAAVNAAISARAANGLVQDYTIGTRNLKREPIAGLLALRTSLLIRVRREKVAQSIANGLGNPSKTFVRWRG
jgi:hypothetical protein